MEKLHHRDLYKKLFYSLKSVFQNLYFRKHLIDVL